MWLADALLYLAGSSGPLSTLLCRHAVGAAALGSAARAAGRCRATLLPRHCMSAVAPLSALLAVSRVGDGRSECR